MPSMYSIVAATLVATTTASSPCETNPTCLGGFTAREVMDNWIQPNDLTFEFLGQSGCEVQGCYDTTEAPQTVEENGCSACEELSLSEYCETQCYGGCGFSLLGPNVEISGFQRYLGNFDTPQECREAWVESLTGEENALEYTQSFIFGFGSEESGRQGECYAESAAHYLECANVFETDDEEVDPFALLGNGFCDSEFNTEVCGYDAGDCCQETCGQTRRARSPFYGVNPFNLTEEPCQTFDNCVSLENLEPLIRVANFDLFQVDVDVAYDAVEGSCRRTTTTEEVPSTIADTTTPEPTAPPTTAETCYFPGLGDQCGATVRSPCVGSYCDDNNRIDRFLTVTVDDCYAAILEQGGVTIWQYNADTGLCKYTTDDSCSGQDDLVDNGNNVQIYDSEFEIPCLAPGSETTGEPDTTTAETTDSETTLADTTTPEPTVPPEPTDPPTTAETGTGFCYNPVIGDQCGATARTPCVGSYCDNNNRIDRSLTVTVDDCYAAILEQGGVTIWQYNADTGLCKYTTDDGCNNATDLVNNGNNVQIYDSEFEIPCLFTPEPIV